ncbi:ABC transporter permease [Streptococcus sp. DD13]|uniref:ABC transporter permease n=1 Tax=Streptococcus sp. DD13 TaxID=1777881 RepID=UPI000793E484|nr:ABC transporter permease [Streptococcus sp. DD13]KXT78126.1 hypothetical protein STRDD13_00951 [Streptococcus sp. DD13]
MLHTIQADFYRLFRSKGFWITEAILILLILAGVIFGATAHFGVNTESTLPQATEVWTGFKALTNYSASISMTIFFTIIIVTLVLGTDLTQNLYKNSLAYGVSRTSYYFAKSAVILTIALFQFLVVYGFVFLLATLCNGMGVMPEHFVSHFGLTFLLQFLSTLAWVSITSFLLYASQSITLAFVGYFVGNLFLSLPALFFKDIEIFHYLNLEFQYSMVQSTTAMVNTLVIALGFILVFGFLGLATFKHKDL